MRHISLTENEICKKTMTYGRKSYEKQKTLLGIRFNSMYAGPEEAPIQRGVQREIRIKGQRQMQAEPLPTKK